MKVKFGSIITEGHGRIGGTVVQGSPSGPILRIAVSTAKKKTLSSGTHQSMYTSIASKWRTLSDIQRKSFDVVNKDDLDPFIFFLSLNLNLISSGYPAISEYTGKKSVFPDNSFQASFSAYDETFLISYLSNVPVGQAVKVFATPVMSSGVSNPRSAYRQIGIITSGDLYAIDLFSQYVQVFGIPGNQNGKVFLRFVPFSTISGETGPISFLSLQVSYVNENNVGLNWTNLGNMFGGVQVFSIQHLVHSITMAGISTLSYLLRSTNYGLTWLNLGTQYSQTLISSISNVAGKISLIGTQSNGKILRSIDYGETWSDLGQQFGQTDIAYIHHIGNGICLAGTQPNGKILRSTDYGLTWSDLGQQFGQSEVSCLSSINSGVCLAGTSPDGLILKSTDYGATWLNLGQLFGASFIPSIFLQSDGLALASSSLNARIFRSTDYGETWADLGQQFAQINIFYIINAKHGIFLASTSPGGLILRSTDYGATWSNLGQQFAQTRIRSLAYAENGICLAGTSPGGLILRSVST